MGDAAGEIRIIRREVEDAANAMISAAVRGLDLVERAGRGDANALGGLEEILCAILQACAFQDLTGQRLDRLSAMGVGMAGDHDRDPLLNGPADPGEGLGQNAADLLFAEGIGAR